MDLNGLTKEIIEPRLKNELPPTMYSLIYNGYKILDPRQDTVVLVPKQDCWFKCDFTNGESGYSPTRGGRIPSYAFAQRLKRKYSYEGFVEIKSNDDIIDVGGFNGTFALMATSIADHIIVLEPSSRNLQCIKNNTRFAENVETIQKAAWHENSRMKLQMGADPTDDSLINIDKGSKINEETVETITLDSLLKDIDMNIDFLKIDAEGAEPDVIQGLTDNFPQKVAVDGSAERQGASTKNQVVSLLEDRGYAVRTKADSWNHMVYAKYD